MHRDLKPANVMITPSGVVKVLDFGIAKLLTTDEFSASAGGVDTLLTVPVVGTPSYMSPEQVNGTAVDKRTDIWAFGCVLYEMVTGRRAFEREAVTDTLAAIVDGEPDWKVLPSNTPERVESLLRRCLHKDPRWRLRDIGDARIELTDGQNQGERKDASTAVGPARWLLWLASIIILTLVGALFALWQRRMPPPLPEMRVEVTTPPSADPVSFAMAPDGRTIAFAATDHGRSRLWLRAIGSTSLRPLEGTDNAYCPFWSPDSSAVGFFADGKLKRVDVDTGSVRTLTNALSCGGTWNTDNTILFSEPLFGPISRISATSPGASATARIDVTRTDRPRQAAHRAPHFLPDGRHFLYYVAGTLDARGVYVGDLDGSEPRRLLDADTAAIYVSPGHLLFARQGTLFAQKFDAGRMATSGVPFEVEEHVAFDPTKYIAAVCASASGVVAYRAGLTVGRRQFVWLDRSGKEIEKVGEPDSAGPLDPSLSPDEHRVAVYRTVNGRPDVWLFEVGRGALNVFTSEEITGAGSGAIRPPWSPDGNQIVFSSIAKKVTDLFLKSVGGGKAKLLLETDEAKGATDWSKDGRFILYRSTDRRTGWDLWALPMNRDGSPGPPAQVVRTNFDETNGQFSPDGKWIAYQSNATGRFEVYVKPFPGPGPESRVSGSGGGQVRWRRDGRELFYIALDNRLMAVPILPASQSQSLEIGTPVPLFTTHIGGAIQGPNMQQYMVGSDAQRFLMNAVVEDPTSPIVVLLNWQPSR